RAHGPGQVAPHGNARPPVAPARSESARSSHALLDPEVRVPGDLPQEAVRVREVAVVTAPESIRGGLYQAPAGRDRLREQLLDLGARAHVVGSATARKPEPCAATPASYASSSRGKSASQVPRVSKKTPLPGRSGSPSPSR